VGAQTIVERRPLSFETLPARIEDEAALEELLSRPTRALIDDLAGLDGDIVVLGVAGKVGPTLARMAKRAAPGKTVLGVARFSSPELRRRIESWGVETTACDLLDREALAKLPKLPNVIFMAGKKFGTGDDPSFAWAMNAHVPALVASEFRASRIVAFSTLCVYPFGPVLHQGWDEATAPQPPGDYANSCVGRERAFEYGSRRWSTPGRLIRLNYAIDMRYGVLHDIARWVMNEEPIPIDTGHASLIWQGDASAQILRSLSHCTAPTSPLNVGGPELASVRAIAEEFGRRFGKKPVYRGVEQEYAWVNNTFQAQRLFGYPVVPLGRMIDWMADWMLRGAPVYGKPTRYEVRDGRF
jgi:nucleoside-diphosphate-sugar epimerase